MSLYPLKDVVVGGSFPNRGERRWGAEGRRATLLFCALIRSLHHADEASQSRVQQPDFHQNMIAFLSRPRSPLCRRLMFTSPSRPTPMMARRPTVHARLYACRGHASMGLFPQASKAAYRRETLAFTSTRRWRHRRPVPPHLNLPQGSVTRSPARLISAPCAPAVSRVPPARISRLYVLVHCFVHR